jgi:2-keto-3-deoxy-L-rhamnonate aldolase RhmA
MRQNRVKKVMKDGKLALGSYVSFADPAVIEIIGLAGFDAAFIDMEHTSFGLNLVEQMIRAADLAEVTSVIRVPDNDAKLILRILEMGGQGIIVPHVDGVEGARKAVDAVRYAPMGQRGGAGSTRAAGYGSVPWREHVQTSNEEVMLSLMLEDEKGLDDAEQIAAMEGVDLVALGPTDLSETLGVTDPKDPRLRQKVEEIAAIVRRVGKAKLSIPVNHAAMPLTPQDLMDLGAGYTHVGPSPVAAVLNALRESVKRVREQTGQPVTVQRPSSPWTCASFHARAT